MFVCYKSRGQREGEMGEQRVTAEEVGLKEESRKGGVYVHS